MNIQSGQLGKEGQLRKEGYLDLSTLGLEEVKILMSESLGIPGAQVDRYKAAGRWLAWCYLIRIAGEQLGVE